MAQGALAVGDVDNSAAAIKKLYKCENLSRPLGSGIVGDHPKASLNALEAIWQSLNPAEFKKIREMVDVLVAAHRRNNRIGILVALERERNACIAQFEEDGARQTEKDDVVEINHEDYDVVILTGKAIIEAAVATGKLIKEHQVTRVMMVGIAGSLGQPVRDKSKRLRKFKRKPKFKGPKVGDVVIATSTAEYGLRQKVRKETINAPVPFNRSDWTMLPTDLMLFARAHEAALKLSNQFKIHEGLIVTGNGIKDHAKEKRNILKERPGGLAVAEEGFPAALLSLHYGIPYLEIRGISDLAQGDKKKQQRNPGQEEREQNLAATNAAKVALALTKSLSKSWQ